MKDNRVYDAMVCEKNTLFIRNPKTAEPYSRGDLSDTEKSAIDKALMGRGLHCEFGLEPVNLNTGNFYMDQTDSTVADLGGDFGLSRSYNSLGAGTPSPFGYGWTFTYAQQLFKDAEGNFLWLRDDGSILTFEDKGDGTYTCLDGYDYTLEMTADGNLVVPEMAAADDAEDSDASGGAAASNTPGSDQTEDDPPENTGSEDTGAADQTGPEGNTPSEIGEDGSATKESKESETVKAAVGESQKGSESNPGTGEKEAGNAETTAPTETEAGDTAAGAAIAAGAIGGASAADAKADGPDGQTDGETTDAPAGENEAPKTPETPQDDGSNADNDPSEEDPVPVSYRYTVTGQDKTSYTFDTYGCLTAVKDVMG